DRSSSWRVTIVTLAEWLANRWTVEHEPAREEIADLLAVVDRDLEDAAIPRLSPDWRLGISYNAALQLATLALAAEGFRPGRDRAHERAILSLRDTVGIAPKTVDLLDTIRRKRNQINYDRARTTSAAEAEELREVVIALRTDVVRWLKKQHRALCPPGIAT
ncbi:MAG: hypothetical protein ABI647_17345, partial [Gemmatimonadota bacterium]